MNLINPIRPVFVIFAVIFTFLSPAHALDGVRAGDCYTTEDGVNHCGGSGSGSSDYGWTYTYGYTDGSAQSSGPTWADRAEARRLQQEAEAIAAVQREAVRLNELGVEASNRNDWRTALSYYEQAHATNPSDPVIANNVRSARGTGFNEEANQAYERGDYAAAVDGYTRALELKPDSQVIRDNLADAQNQLQIKESQAAAERKNQEDLAQAGQKMKEKLSGFSLSAPQNTAQAAPTSGLSFKGAAAENKLSAWDQLKNAWAKGKEAKNGVTEEDASMKAREGFDTSKNPQTSADVDSSVVDLRDKSGVVNTDVLKFKSAAPTAPKPKATQIPEFDPTLDPTPLPVKGPEFDPSLDVTPLPEAQNLSEEQLQKLREMANSLPSNADLIDMVLEPEEAALPVIPKENLTPEEYQKLLEKARSLPPMAAQDMQDVALNEQTKTPQDTFMEILDKEFKNSQKEKK
jgi:tetratricopeptide (TPR) repeat protein